MSYDSTIAIKIIFIFNIPTYIIVSTYFLNNMIKNGKKIKHYMHLTVLTEFKKKHYATLRE